MLIQEKSVTLLFILFCSGLKITGGRSTDNVRPDRGLDRSNSRLASHFDRSNSHLAGHFDRSFLDSNIFVLLHSKPSKKKNATINEFHVNEMQQSETLTN